MLFHLKFGSTHFFAQTVRIKLVSPQAAQLSILYWKISSVAPPQGTWLRTHFWWDREKKRKDQLPGGIESGTSRSVVRCATTWANPTALPAQLRKLGNTGTSACFHLGLEAGQWRHLPKEIQAWSKLTRTWSSGTTTRATTPFRPTSTPCTTPSTGATSRTRLNEAQPGSQPTSIRWRSRADK